MKNKPSHFVVSPGEKINLKHRPTSVEPFYESDEEYDQLLDRHKCQLRELQELLYAQSRYALLIVFQGMDAGGKDSAIEHVMSGVNPQGCMVHSFKQPSTEEQAHDFIWRAARALPERGKIGIFNRSYYEEVLVVRVHPEILEREPLPKERLEDQKIWEERFESIVDFERHLHRNGTQVVKFFLHLSKAEQRKRFLARLEEPQKHWKFAVGDLEERKRWKDYMAAYEEALSTTSRKHAPWYIVPADDKKNARLIISEILVETLRGMDLSFPELSAAQESEFKKIRARLER